MEHKFNETMEALKDDINTFCKLDGISLEKVEIGLVVLDNLDTITTDSIQGFNNLKNRIRQSIGDRRYRAIHFFVTGAA
jgi:hypothetical protein